MNMTRREMMQLLAGAAPAVYLSPVFGQASPSPANVATDATTLPPAPTPIPVPPGFGVASGPFQPSWESLSGYKVPDWYAQKMYQFNSPVYKFHVQKYGHPSKFGFKDVINQWKAEQWDPQALVNLYKRAGAKFFAAMANHHDNLDMWDSTYQPWNSVAVGPKKNIIAGWEKATRETGLHFAVSCHGDRAWDWLQVSQDSDREGPLAGVPYDGRLTKADGKGRWWEGLDPQDLYAQYHPRGKYRWTLEGNPPVDRAYCEKFFNRMIDLIDKYKPDLLYFDDTVLPIYPSSDIGLRIAAYFYNTNLARNGNMEAVLTGKGLNAEQRRALVWDVERGVTEGGETLPWQTDTCIGSWRYERSVYEQHTYKTAGQVVQMLIDIVSKNGNLMLSVPLRGNGTLDDDEVKIVEGIGEWMAPNGEGIYATRPWKVYGEGPSVDNPPPRGRFGGARDVRPYTAEDIRFTAKGDILFAFMMAWPQTGKAMIKSLAQGSEHFPQEIARIELLGAGGPLTFTRDASGLVVNLPEKKPNEYAYALKIVPQ